MADNKLDARHDATPQCVQALRIPSPTSTPPGEQTEPKPLRLDTFKGKRIDEFDAIVLIDNILNSAWDEHVFLEGYTASADT